MNTQQNGGGAVAQRGRAETLQRMTMVPGPRDRVYVKGRRGLFVLVSMGDHAAQVMALEGTPRVMTVPLDQIEAAPELNARTFQDGKPLPGK
jgi:hypothetical protein